MSPFKFIQHYSQPMFWRCATSIRESWCNKTIFYHDFYNHFHNDTTNTTIIGLVFVNFYKLLLFAQKFGIVWIYQYLHFPRRELVQPLSQ